MSNFNTLLKEITIMKPYVLTAPSIYFASNTVTINTKVDDATILYTTDGTEPVLSTATEYTEPFAITHTVTVKAIVIRPGYKRSNTTTHVCEYETDYTTVPFFVKNNNPEDSITLSINSLTGASLPDNAKKFSCSYSFDNDTWTQTSDYYNGLSVTIPASGILYIKFAGYNQWYASNTYYYRKMTVTGASEYGVDVGGNINSLWTTGDWYNLSSISNGSQDIHFVKFINEMPIVSAENLTLPCRNVSATGGGYQYMFYNCTTLVKAPKVLPLMVLPSYVYRYMFMGCTSLTTAPLLACTDYVSAKAYDSMFKNCTSLNYIKTMQKNESIDGTSCGVSWVENVGSTGTFVKSADSNWSTIGNNGIPSGWTVQTVANDAPYYYKQITDLSEITDGDRFIFAINQSNANFNTVENTLSSGKLPSVNNTSERVNYNSNIYVYYYGSLYEDLTSDYNAYVFDVSVTNGECTFTNLNGDRLSLDSSGTGFDMNVTGRDKWTIERPGGYGQPFLVRNVYDTTKIFAWDKTTYSLYPETESNVNYSTVYGWMYLFKKHH